MLYSGYAVRNFGGESSVAIDHTVMNLPDRPFGPVSVPLAMYFHPYAVRLPARASPAT